MILQLQKRTMAIAGIIMTLYLIFHMLMNLSFINETVFTEFYQWYNDGVVRWPMLLLFMIALLIHVKAAITIRLVNSKARLIAYQKHDKFHVPAALVTLSIVWLFMFIVIHVFQTLTMDVTNLHAETSALFQSTLMTLFYLSSLFILFMHLQHSLANVLQTLGKTSATFSGLVIAATLLLTGGFAFIPLYIYVVAA